MERIDAMQEELTTIDSELKGFSNKIYSGWITKGDTIVQNLKKFESDTITIEVAKKMNTFKRLHEMLPLTLTLRDQILKQLNETKTDLKNLRKDISEGSGRRGKYEEYISKEEKKCRVLKEEFERCSNMVEEISEGMETIYTEMELLIVERNKLEEVQ